MPLKNVHNYKYVRSFQILPRVRIRNDNRFSQIIYLTLPTYPYNNIIRVRIFRFLNIIQEFCKSKQRGPFNGSTQSLQKTIVFGYLRIFRELENILTKTIVSYFGILFVNFMKKILIYFNFEIYFYIFFIIYQCYKTK